MKLLQSVILVRVNYIKKVELLVLSATQYNLILIFVPFLFSFFIFPGDIRPYQWFVFFLCYRCRHNTTCTRTAPRLINSKKFSPIRWGSCLDGWPNTPCCNNFIFFSFPFLHDISDSVLNSQSSVMCSFSIYKLFGSNHSAMSVFIFEALVYNTV